MHGWDMKCEYQRNPEEIDDQSFAIVFRTVATFDLKKAQWILLILLGFQPSRFLWIDILSAAEPVVNLVVG